MVRPLRSTPASPRFGTDAKTGAPRWQAWGLGRGDAPAAGAAHLGPLQEVDAWLAADPFSTNARLRWEYQPGSELFVVYNEDRDTLTPRFPDLSNRAFIVKYVRQFDLLN